jgi:hypothetical protein
MSDTSSAAADSLERSQEEFFSGLFAQLVIQQTNMAMMLLGKVPHPETGKTIKDTDAARLFIDQLEMLEAKTKGNLTKEESGLLKQSLMSLRLTFVDAVNSEDTIASQSSHPSPEAPQAESGPQTSKPGEPKADPSTQEEEHRKKFSKKY